jgi:hypothetical protein
VASSFSASFASSLPCVERSFATNALLDSSVTLTLCLNFNPRSDSTNASIRGIATESGMVPP